MNFRIFGCFANICVTFLSHVLEEDETWKTRYKDIIFHRLQTVLVIKYISILVIAANSNNDW